MKNDIIFKLQKLTTSEIKRDVPLAKYTTLKIGGSADYFIEPISIPEMIAVYQTAIENGIKCTILGGGSNILISDKGIRGIVIKNKVTGISYGNKIKINFRKTASHRHEEIHWKTGFIKLTDLDYDEDTQDAVLVKVNSGTSLQLLMYNTLHKGLTGLQWFARIPGTLGGAVWNNIHGGKKFISDFINSVSYIDSYGKQQILQRDNLSFDYNRSNFQNSNNLITEVGLVLQIGNKNKAMVVAEEWKKRKSDQPYNSAGSTFSNLSEEDKLNYGLSSISAGYIIDKILGLKGFKIGKVKISENHSNFLETELGATSADALEIINTVKVKAKEKIGIDLNLEIVLLGDF
jgi:UDP-N-acetylmuramate dehydrogenase